MSIEGQCIVCLDLETLFSADSCRHCGQDEAQHYADGACAPWTGDRPSDDIHQFSALGWDNKPALGISIGCYWDYRDSRIHWFDVPTLEATVRHLVETAPLLVSFNGIGFDFPLMRGLLRRFADGHEQQESVPPPLEAWAQDLHALCDTFKAQCEGSYDLLAALWKADPPGKRIKGLNSLDAIAQANGFGAKLSHGAQAPRDWRNGQYAKVLNYCQDDVYKTKALFELVITNNGCILRGDGQVITLTMPIIP